MELHASCPRGTTRLVPQENFPQKPHNKSFFDQACSVKMVNNPYILPTHVANHRAGFNSSCLLSELATFMNCVTCKLNLHYFFHRDPISSSLRYHFYSQWSLKSLLSSFSAGHCYINLNCNKNTESFIMNGPSTVTAKYVLKSTVITWPGLFQRWIMLSTG